MEQAVTHSPRVRQKDVEGPKPRPAYASSPSVIRRCGRTGLRAPHGLALIDTSPPCGRDTSWKSVRRLPNNPGYRPCGRRDFSAGAIWVPQNTIEYPN
jgi:hypothetical protein